MSSITIRKWLVWVFVVCILATTRAEYMVTDDQYDQCHASEWTEYTTCEIKILWITLHRMGWSETIQNDWSEPCN